MRVKSIDVTTGAITSVSIFSDGLYSIPPDSPVLTTGGSGTGLQIDGSWQLTDHSVGLTANHIVYDTVLTLAELNFLTAEALYAVGDVVKVIQSDQIDPWDSSQVAAYYRYNGTNWNVVGIDHHTFSLNSNIVSNIKTFRDFFQNLGENISRIQINRILFTLLYEMIRQNPNCDWFFKTSYIDLHTTQEIPNTPYIFPDQATAIKESILNLKPFRTKLRDEIVTYRLPEEDIIVGIHESQIDRVTLIFDRVACNLNDENSWDTIPWDATVTYPDADTISLSFLGTGIQRCFVIPEAVPPEELFVFVNGHLSIPTVDYLFDPISFSICFNVAPNLGDVITVIIDGPYEYFVDFEWTFHGNSIVDSEVLPNRVSETVIGNVFSNWNGVHQISTIDYFIQVTSDTEVVYNVIPTSEIFVNGTAFGGVLGDIFVETTIAGDGVTQTFGTLASNQTLDTVVVFLNGIWQTPGTSYVVDPDTNSLVVLTDIPLVGDTVVIYAVATPDWVDCGSFVFTGDGSTNTFAISGLDDPVPPMIFANIDGIQQNQDHGDFTVNSTDIIFTQTPRDGADIAIFVVWTGIGRKLAGSSYPQTIQWDWAFWNYADLGRQEYDFAGFFIGNGITESFTVIIPQQSSLLYSVAIKFFQNGVLTSLSALGLTMMTTKLASGVVVFLSGPLPLNTYGALYVSRGFFEGLEPTFGFQDLNGIVFAPTGSSYQHFFARLISANFDPSVDMVGCPDNSPEERIQSTVDDLWTIAVKVYTQVFKELQTMSVIGVGAIGEIGDFTFIIETNPIIIGQETQAEFGDLIIMNQWPPFDLTGLNTSSAIGVLGIENDPAMLGQVGFSNFGVFGFQMDTNPDLIGVAGLSNSPTFSFSFSFDSFTNVEAISASGSLEVAFGDLTGQAAGSHTGTLSHEIDFSFIGVNATANEGTVIVQLGVPMSGQAAISEFINFTTIEDTAPSLIGVQAGTHIPQVVVDRGRGASAVVVSYFGNLVPRVIHGLPSLAVTSQIGAMYPSPIILRPSGIQANSELGRLGSSITF